MLPTQGKEHWGLSGCVATYHEGMACTAAGRKEWSQLKPSYMACNLYTKAGLVLEGPCLVHGCTHVHAHTVVVAYTAFHTSTIHSIKAGMIMHI